MRTFLNFNGLAMSGAVTRCVARGASCHTDSYHCLALFLSSGHSSSPLTPQVASKYKSNTSLFAVCAQGEGRGGYEGKAGTIVLPPCHILSRARTHTVL